ncbi:HNH endonuclease [Sanguibacter sp. HDW7]|nr:HNH endonuclease [Sanguibacter sp. HDW7]
MHYMRRKRSGTTGSAGYTRRPGRTVAERVYPRLITNPETGCWEWTGALRNGYGAVGIGKSVHYVHRWVYVQHVGPIPTDYVIDHLCCNRRCANPEHLEAVTDETNKARGGHAHGTRKETAR